MHECACVTKFLLLLVTLYERIKINKIFIQKYIF